MQRRQFLFALTGLAAVLTTRSFAASYGDKVVVMRFSDDGKPLGLASLDKVHRDWKKSLSSLAYHVTREQGTERAYSVPGYDRHDAGLYRCVCCDNALFSAAAKFDSGTGWPSFWQPVDAHNVREVTDRQFGMTRTEVQCSLCDAHLGHVFDDGPKPSGLRYCMNAVAMRFVAKL